MDAISIYDIPNKIDDREIFLPLVQYRNVRFQNLYYISNYGRVYSTYRGGLFLSPGKNRKGYPFVALMTVDGKLYSKTIHRLEMATFFPNLNMNNLQINHKDGDKTNNRLDNLEWCTQSENIIHAYRHGLMDMSFNRLLSDQEVQNIRELCMSGKSMAEIWRATCKDKIGYDSLCDICNNITYYDPNYTPRERVKLLTKEEINHIRTLYNNGMSKNDIWRNFYINRDKSHIYSICDNKSHYDPNYIPRQ